MMMCSTNSRSSLEIMLDLIKQRDEQPVDVPPALPVRPVSRARLPARSRRLPVTLHKSCLIEGPKENEVKNKQGYSANTVLKKIDSMNLKDDTQERPLEKILEIQKSFRGYQVRCYYLQLKRGTITLQSFIRGETARRNFQFLSRKLEAVIVIQRLAKQLVDRRVMQKRQGAVITLQSAIRGWLTRRSLDHKKVKTAGHIQVSPLALADLHRRLHILETEMGNREEENAIIRRRLHRYDEKWLQYEKKMESMKEKWHDQLASLRTSLLAAKKGLATERTRDRLGNFIPISLNSCSNADCARTMNEFLNLRDVNETRLKNNRVDDTSLHIDSRRSSFHDDSRKSPDEEFQILKLRFEVWKKDYKVQLQEVKTMLQKLGHLETKKNRKKWWVR